MRLRGNVQQIVRDAVPLKIKSDRFSRRWGSVIAVSGDVWTKRILMIYTVCAAIFVPPASLHTQLLDSPISAVVLITNAIVAILLVAKMSRIAQLDLHHRGLFITQLIFMFMVAAVGMQSIVGSEMLSSLASVNLLIELSVFVSLLNIAALIADAFFPAIYRRLWAHDHPLPLGLKLKLSTPEDHTAILMRTVHQRGADHALTTDDVAHSTHKANAMLGYFWRKWYRKIERVLGSVRYDAEINACWMGIDQLRSDGFLTGSMPTWVNLRIARKCARVIQYTRVLQQLRSQAQNVQEDVLGQETNYRSAAFRAGGQRQLQTCVDQARTLFRNEAQRRIHKLRRNYGLTDEQIRDRCRIIDHNAEAFDALLPPPI